MKIIEFDNKIFKQLGDYYCYGLTSLHRYIWEYHNGKIPKNMVIHHKDFNKENNDISNLQLMTEFDHKSLHGKLIKNSGRKKLLSDQQIINLKFDRKSGMIINDLAKKYNISVRSVHNYLNR